MFNNDRILKLATALEWREWLRRPLIWGTHLGLFLISGIAAFLLRFDFSIPASEFRDLMFGLAVWLIAKSAVFRWLELDRGCWRYVSIRDVARLVAANLVASALGCLALLWFGLGGFPRSIYFLDFLVCLGMTAGVRLAVRLSFEFSRLANPGTKKRTLIYGAGNAGVDRKSVV